MGNPRFYYSELNNYTPEFLVEIILWQKIQIDNLMNKIIGANSVVQNIIGERNG